MKYEELDLQIPPSKSLLRLKLLDLKNVGGILKLLTEPRWFVQGGTEKARVL